MKRKNWYPLDNAAKIYPPITNAMRPSTFALMAILSEPIDKDVLEKAVDDILNRFVSFNVKLKKGIFWYYLEENNKPYIVEEEPPYFLRQISATQNNGYLFKVYYRENRITMTVFHSLADGTGALDVFKSLLYEYLLLSGKPVKAEDKIITCVTPYTQAESFDSFIGGDFKTKEKPKKEPSAFKPDGTPFGYDGCGIISGRIDLTDLKRECKKFDTTVTVYLSAQYMYSMYLAFIKGKRANNKDIRLLVPVNLRKWYPSETLRNFAMFVRLGHNFEEEITFEECVNLLKSQLKAELTKETLDSQIWSNVKTEKNWLLKVVPLFVKDIVMRVAYDFVGDNLHSANVSNLGDINLPKSMKPYVDDVVFLLGASFSTKTNLSIIGYDDHVTVTSCRLMVENQLEKHFFRSLADRGIKVQVSSNYWEAK